MSQHLKGVAKRLTFSLLLASGLAGCAAYEPTYPGGYSSYDTYPYDTYPYGQSVYSIAPDYMGAPAFFDFGSFSEGGHRHDGFHDGRHRFHGGDGFGHHEGMVGIGHHEGAGGMHTMGTGAVGARGAGGVGARGTSGVGARGGENHPTNDRH
jgi:hypothetical protein